MLRNLVVEFVVPILVFLFLRSFLGNLFSARRSDPTPHAPPQPSVVSGGELKKDPVCGTYVSTSLAVTRKVNGQVVHFCSKECSERYQA
jgi:YHS domain-containing protein